jgi:hypothetical protein
MARIELAPWMAVLVLFLTAHLLANGWFYAASDDPYIYLGYVKMLIQSPHGLFSYNIGEHSAATTGVMYYYSLIPAALFARGLTFHLPLAESLTLGLYLLNSALFLGMAVLLLKGWERLVTAPEEERFWRALLPFALVSSHPKFIWGVFAGLENPLAAFLMVLLAYLLIAGSPFWRVSLAAAALGATRPELNVVLSLVPALAVAVRRLAVSELSRKERLKDLLRWETGRDLLLAYAIWGGGLAALYLPCYVMTGQVFPSSLGPRVQIDALSNPALLWSQFIASFSSGLVWGSSWALWGYFLLVLSLCLLPFIRTGEAVAAAVFILLSFGVRAAFGLTDFNAEDRYVSYLWPLYALGLSQCLDRVWRKIPRIVPGTPALRTAVLTLLLAAAMVLPGRTLWRTFQLDVEEMNDIVVEPSRWMAKNLRPGTRVSMEPAGAIRVFTDFYLVDRTGLTTNHLNSYPGNYWDFLRKNRVEYIFDYPGMVPILQDTRFFSPVKFWAPRQHRRSLGRIGLYRTR